MNRGLFVSNAFAEQPIGLRPSPKDRVFDILFCGFRVGRLDLTTGGQEDN